MPLKESDLYSTLWASCDELRGKSDIGDRINTQVIAPLVQANDRLARSDFPDFNDPNKLGQARTRFLAEQRRARRHPRRCLRVPDVPLRHREWQEQGAVLYPRRGQPGDRPGDRRRSGQLS